MARRPMEAAGAVDAQNAPTAPWKTAQHAVSHSYHRRSHRESGTRVLPMFPVNFVTDVPGCSRHSIEELNDSSLQRILATNDDEAIFLDQLLEDVRPVAQMVC
jgi:hypothetical protein